MTTVPNLNGSASNPTSRKAFLKGKKGIQQCQVISLQDKVEKGISDAMLLNAKKIVVPVNLYDDKTVKKVIKIYTDLEWKIKTATKEGVLHLEFFA
ncbi:MAG TPA: hypothetical protein VK502_03510 [Candidatus Saccharimonadales bacterium]|nr:hypothetical protein [Candidatus Saccharimonadales bacterium]